MVSDNMKAVVLGFVGLAVCVRAVFNTVVPTDDALPTGNPPAFFDRRENVVFPFGVSPELMNTEPAVLHTNKFYTNFLLEQAATRAAWTLPYTITVNTEAPFGMYVSHPRFFEGQFADDGRLRWYANAAVKDIIMTATELNLFQEATLTDFDEFGLSATVMFISDDDLGGSMTTYLVQGMAYATVLYDSFTPEMSSTHAILRVNGVDASQGNHVSADGRFEVDLNDGSTWILYSSEPDIEFSFEPGMPESPNKLISTGTMSGTLRATLIPYAPDEANYDEAVALLDAHSGVYPVSGAVTAEVEIDAIITGRYTIEWVVAGDTSVDLLQYALPHQQDLMPAATKTSIYLRSPTKGNMMLVTSNAWEIEENDLPDLEWVPPESAATDPLEREWIDYHLESEIGETLDNYAGNSVYFGAKHLMTYAQLCLVAEELGRTDLVESCVDQVESALAEYVSGQNGNPLVIDTTWGGLIGSLGLEEGGEGADFYAAHYNDHHFHYSYLLNAAAVIAKLRPAWAAGNNKAYVDTLIRDVNSPSTTDAYFPAFRSFDWFCGHSWARGLLFAFDGKDEESTSEDVNFYYALTMWAIATGNPQLEGLGRLQTAMVTRSIQRYFLMKDDNDVHPSDFVPNKVTGIYFENKVDYTTWFGDNPEYIHGIQNIPVTAVTEHVRDPQFCSEEWTGRLEGVVDGATGVWKTVLYMSYATIQKHLAFKEMLTSGVDDGLSRTWALYWATTRPDCATYCEHDPVDLDAAPVTTLALTESSGGYGGSATIPGSIESEEFDFGGQGVAYSDADPSNNGGAFRTDEGVDVQTFGGGQYYVGWTNAGEYLRYSVDVSSTATYDFQFAVAAPFGLSAIGTFRVVAGGSGCDTGTDLTGTVEVAPTGSWDSFETIDMPGIAVLTAGSTFLYFCIESSGFNIDSFGGTTSAPTPTSAPTEAGFGYEGGASVPGTIEVERYDYGGQNVAYSDWDAQNTGGDFRLDEGVDVGLSSNTFYFVGWILGGEWMRYTVSVTEAADAYDFEIRTAATGMVNDAFRIVAGGTDCTDYETDLTGPVTVPATGGWSLYTTYFVSGAGNGGLSAGHATLFLCVESSGFNIDWFSMTAA